MGRYGQIRELVIPMIPRPGHGCAYIAGETICIDGAHPQAAPAIIAGAIQLDDDTWSKIRVASGAAAVRSSA